MTTIAFDGMVLAADTLGVDHYGLRSTIHKIINGPVWVAGFAGSHGKMIKWQNATRHMGIDEVLAYGYPTFEKEVDDPAIMVIERASGLIWRHTDGVLTAHHNKQFAIGSGRDYALMAMHMGLSSKRAIIEVSKFDVYTNDMIDELEL